MVEQKCEADPDGDRPIRWTLVNWCTHYPMRYVPITHNDGDMTFDERWELLRDYKMNLSIAQRDLETFLHELEGMKIREARDAIS